MIESTLFYGYDPVEEAIDSYVYGGISIEALEHQLELALTRTNPQQPASNYTQVIPKVEWMEDSDASTAR